MPISVSFAVTFFSLRKACWLVTNEIGLPLILVENPT
jgi:hypothetical protein